MPLCGSRARSLTLISFAVFEKKEEKYTPKKCYSLHQLKKNTNLFFSYFLNINFSDTCLKPSILTHSISFISFAARSLFVSVCLSPVCLCVRAYVFIFFLLFGYFTLVATIFPVDRRFYYTIIITNEFVTCLISSVFDRNQLFARNQSENPLTWQIELPK